jgi:hypothetical protein
MGVRAQLDQMWKLKPLFGLGGVSKRLMTTDAFGVSTLISLSPCPIATSPWSPCNSSFSHPDAVYPASGQYDLETTPTALTHPSLASSSRVSPSLSLWYHLAACDRPHLRRIPSVEPQGCVLRHLTRPRKLMIPQKACGTHGRLITPLDVAARRRGARITGLLYVPLLVPHLATHKLRCSRLPLQSSPRTPRCLDANT